MPLVEFAGDGVGKVWREEDEGPFFYFFCDHVKCLRAQVVSTLYGQGSNSNDIRCHVNVAAAAGLKGGFGLCNLVFASILNKRKNKFIPKYESHCN